MLLATVDMAEDDAHGRGKFFEPLLAQNSIDGANFTLLQASPRGRGRGRGCGRGRGRGRGRGPKAGRGRGQALDPHVAEAANDMIDGEDCVHKCGTRLRLDRDWSWLIPADPSFVQSLCAQELREADEMPPYFPELLEHLLSRQEQAQVSWILPV